jgi:hypothetical protein
VSPDLARAAHDHDHGGHPIPPAQSGPSTQSGPSAPAAAEVPAWDGTAPVWWSAWERLSVAFALVAALWLLIAWAVRG